MKFTFEPWRFGDDTRGARKMADFLREHAATPAIADLLATTGPPDRRIDFLVVDVTPAAILPDRLEHALAELLSPVDKPWIDDPAKTICRFLFVGATSALDEWELEQDSVSAKKMVEFYIRTLQNADIAHYGTGGPDVDNLSAPLATSALLGLARFYARGRLAPLHDKIEALRSHVDTVFSHARQNHGHLIDLYADLPQVVRDMDLLLSLNAVIQLGKRNPARAHSHAKSLRLTPDRGSQDEWERDSGGKTAEPAKPSAYGLWTDLDAAIAKWGGLGAPADLADTIQIADLSLGLQRYNILRDLARCIGTGAVPALKAARKRLRDGTGMLIVDDRLWAAMKDWPDHPLRAGLAAKLNLVDWRDSCFVTTAATFGTFEAGDLLQADEAMQRGIDILPLDAASRPLAQRPRPEDFRLILVEVDSSDRFLGPKLVHRISTYLASAADRTRGEDGKPAAAGDRAPPPIIVLTRTESFGHIQQSLNFGASAYVLKDRLFQLPYQMNQALNAVKWKRDRTPYSSSFRALHALRPEIRAKLHTSKGPSFVYGGRTSSDSSRILSDCRELKWVRELPKADLHCHLGTCIHPSAIHVLALNTVGHVLEAKELKHEPAGRQTAVDRILLAVLLAEHFQAAAPEISPIVCLAVAAAPFAEKPPKELPSYGIGDRIVAWLNHQGDDLTLFQTAAILTAAMGWTPDDEEGAIPPIDPLAFLDGLAAIEKAGPDRRRQNHRFDRRRALAIAAKSAMLEIVKIESPRPGKRAGAPRVERSWSSLRDEIRHRTEKSREKIEVRRAALWERLTSTGPGLPKSRQRLAELLVDAVDDFAVEDIAQQTGATSLKLGDIFGLPGPRTAKPGPAPVQRYVELPHCGADGMRERGLLRYLWGADFLGADHLQHPENLLMAAYAVTRDNAQDNVIYSEIRCETPGYCRGGMRPQEATDLLRLSFDLASLYIAGQDNVLPLVRTNILLAAKRHKDEAKAIAVIKLLEGHLVRPADARYREIFPEDGWWQPTRIVGFDLSGDESQTPKWLAHVLQPLADLSSPITIHAGEAADVDSVKSAVHQHHARRIGHGLRLQAEPDLQDYCAREGICMEMCPNSNAFTNAFDPPEEGEDDDAFVSRKTAYPLRAYMEAGLEVCLATDNRYLHRVGAQTLTSEYVTAARLSNGLTRWEILQLVKAGFKNAFLSKPEVNVLVSAMEERVYRIVSRGWF